MIVPRRSNVMGHRASISVVVGDGAGDVPAGRRDTVADALRSVGATVATAHGHDAAVAAAADLVPDVLVLVDGGSAVDRAGLGAVCADLVSHTPATRLVVITAVDDDLAYETLLQGAFSVLAPVPSAALVIVDAVRGAARGESTVSPGCARRLIEDADRAAAASDPFAPNMRLTETEREVLTRLAAGEPAASIAARHDVTPRLVNLHAGYAVAKLHHHVHRARARAMAR
jgi:DNA-binding NarL/FixJ family response regulator